MNVDVAFIGGTHVGRGRVFVDVGLRMMISDVVLSEEYHKSYSTGGIS